MMQIAKFLPALAFGVALTAPAVAQTEPATSAQIVEGIEACRAITSPDKVEFRQLESLGWPTAERRGGNRTRNKVIGAHQKPGNPALVVVADDQVETKTCVVRARLADSSSYGPTLQALSEIIGMLVRAEESSYFWDLDGYELRVDPTGSRDEPVARFQISANPTSVSPADQQETAE
ncbi:hypothetical protein LCM19_03105 [Qipengyuania flava]|nr:hypothetical protein [Qipengyuania flava]